MQANLDLVVAGGLHVARQLEPPLVQVGTAGALDRGGHLGRSDRTVEPATVTGADSHLDRELLERRLDLVGVPEVAHLAGRAGPLDDVDLLFGTAGPRNRERLRQQVVAPITALDVHDVARRTEAGYLLGKDDPHVDPPQRAVAV